MDEFAINPKLVSNEDGRINTSLGNAYHIVDLRESELFQLPAYIPKVQVKFFAAHRGKNTT